MNRSSVYAIVAAGGIGILAYMYLKRERNAASTGAQIIPWGWGALKQGDPSTGYTPSPGGSHPPIVIDDPIRASIDLMPRNPGGTIDLVPKKYQLNPVTTPITQPVKNPVITPIREPVTVLPIKPPAVPIELTPVFDRPAIGYTGIRSGDVKRSITGK